MNSQNILVWLNFFVADVADGLGPFLGVFLKSQGFLEDKIGIISTISSLAALIFLIPFGILIDKTRFKKQLICLCIIVISLSTFTLLFYHSFVLAMIAQFSIAMAGACLTPAFAALTLGIVGFENYKFQVARNEAYKHAGTVFAAALSFVFAYYYGIVSVFIITIAMSVFSLWIISLIKQNTIDHKIACGEIGDKSTFKQIFFNKNVIILALVMFCFHMSNAHMLPLLSQRAFSVGIDSSGAYAAATIIIAQSAMIVVSLLCFKILKKNNNFTIYFYSLAVSLVGLIIRGFIAANFVNTEAMVIVQILDGVGAGITGVILPILLSFILRGSGHINTGLTIVIAAGGIGAALSGSVGGIIATKLGYFYAYSTLAFIAFAGLLLWIFSFKYLSKGLFIEHRARK